MIKELDRYKQELIKDELAPNTIDKYVRDVELFYDFLNKNNMKLGKNELIAYKKDLETRFKPSTVNNKIITINKYLKFIDKDKLCLKAIREQTNNHSEAMTQNDFERIMRQAKTRNLDRNVMMLDIFYFTGVRVSELQFFTVEAVKKGYMKIDNKGKIRTVPIPKKLQKEARDYIKQNGITTGAVILSRAGNPLSRFTIFKDMKYLAGQARVKKSRVYPHSIRHLFAKNWLSKNGNNVLQLADILGHESLETTRIYTKLNIDELRKTME